MKAFVFRHADSEYLQGITSLEDAADIKQSGIAALICSTREVCGKLFTHVNIQSSAYSRCLASAKEIKKELDAFEIITSDIIPNYDLRKADNFNRYLFQAIVNGEKFTIDDETFNLKDLNPDGLSDSEYFRRDIVHSEYVVSRLPQKALDITSKFEKSQEANTRLRLVLDSLKQNSVLVTHESLINRDYDLLNKAPRSFLRRGHFIMYEKQEAGWTPIYTNSM